MTIAQPGQFGPVDKQRNPIGVVLLSIITLGIYWLVYSYKTFDAMKRHSGVGIGGGIGLVLAFIVGVAVPFVLGSEIAGLRQRAGLPPRVSALTGFWQFLPLIGVFVLAVKMQGALNDYWAGRG